MPFPLAHPAAVFPLRRACPRILSLPALIIGSVVPDASYLLRGSGLEGLAHEAIGIFEFALPAGLFVYICYRALAPVLSRKLAWLVPETAPVGIEPHGVRLAVSVILSILIGAATHVAWDSFTHKEGWAVQHSLLGTALFHYGYRQIRIHHLVWYASTLLGSYWVFKAILDWRCGAVRDAASQVIRSNSAFSWLLAALVVPIAVIHHLFRGVAGDLAVALLSCAVLAMVLARERAK